jgi:hypothetical protein
MVDEERGLLRHICDWGIQPELDELYSKIQLQEYFYNPDHPASWGHLDWLGQFVGLGILDGHWLGVGLKPSWSIATKVDVIKRAWNYWQIKGSEAGIREAIAMWLRFQDKNRLILHLPFGTVPTDEPPNWHGWNTPYDVSLNQTFPEKQRMGWGNYWGNHHQPDYFTLQADWEWEWGQLVDSGGGDYAGEPWQDRANEDGEIVRELDYVAPPDIHMERSRLGDRELWMHFYLKESEWNRIFPDIFELNLETIPITTTASVFGWLQGIRQPAIQPLIQAPQSIEDMTVTEIEFDGMQWGQLLATEGWVLPGDAWAYAGTLWPFDVADPYTTIETVESKIEWGVWEPELWDGQPWGAVIGEAVNHESLSIFLDDLQPVPTLKGETLGIETRDLPYYSDVAPTYWYAPWEERIITETVTVQHPGTGCLEGIPIKFDSTPDILTISLGRSLSQVTNQLFAPYEEPGEPRAVPNDSVETLSISIPRPDSGGFTNASAQVQTVESGIWMDALFFDMGGTVEPQFAPAYVERSMPIDGFDLGNVEGFQPGRTQGNYPIPPGFEEAVIIENDFFSHSSLEGENLSAGDLTDLIIPTTRTQMEMVEPVGIATYGGEYEEYSYYYDSGFTGDISEVAIPMQTLSINTSQWAAVETLSATPEVDGYLCNVFAGWSTLTPTSINQYKVEPEGEDSSIFEAYPLLAQAIDGESWKLLVETEEEFYILQPVTMFWKERGRQIPIGKEVRRSQIFSFEEGMTDLYLEFVFQPKIDTYIHSTSLSLAGKLIQHQNYYYKLNAPDEAYIGFVFDVPFRLPSGAGSPQEEVLLEEILPNLTQELLQLAGLPTNSGLVPTPVITTLPTEPVVSPESLTDILRSLRDLIREKGGDKHFPFTIELPSIDVEIVHNLGKYPSVTFVDTVDGEGNKSYGDVRYIDRNTLVISFSEPTIGRVFCN